MSKTLPLHKATNEIKDIFGDAIALGRQLNASDMEFFVRDAQLLLARVNRIIAKYELQSKPHAGIAGNAIFHYTKAVTAAGEAAGLIELARIPEVATSVRSHVEQKLDLLASHLANLAADCRAKN